MPLWRKWAGINIHLCFLLPTCMVSFSHTRLFTQERICSASTWYAWAVKVKPLLSRQAAEGVTFIGPDTHATQTMGDKIRGKLIAKMPRSVSCPRERGLVKVRRASHAPQTHIHSFCHLKWLIWRLTNRHGASGLMCVFIKTRCCQLAVSSGNCFFDMLPLLKICTSRGMKYRKLLFCTHKCVWWKELLLMRETFKALMMLLQTQSLFRELWFKMVWGCGKIVSPNLSLAFLLLKYWG